jgi:hypothetical protein
MAQWKAAGVVEQLPPEDALASFSSEAYQASLLREEDRLVVCRLILVNPVELGDDAGPPKGLHVLRFEEERPIHEQEILESDRYLLSVVNWRALGFKARFFDLGNYQFRFSRFGTTGPRSRPPSV